VIRFFGKLGVVLAAGGLAAAVTGCGLGGFSAVSTAPSALPAITGSLHGGQQPVSGASIQLYAANPATSKGAATALLATPAVTKADGSFSIDKETDYSCPTPGSLIYLVATHGNPGLVGTVNNSQLALMALVGTCGSLTDSTIIQVNELTTVAGVEALAPFMTDYAHVGADASNPNALAGAFAQAQATVDFTTGNFATPAGGATVPTQLLSSLADILAACVNTGGGTAGDGSGSACSTLMGSAGTGTATETIGAMLQIVQHPATNVTALFGLILGGAPFQPGLGSQPENFVIIDAIYLPVPPGTDTTSSYLLIPYQMAIDSEQNVWIYTPVITSVANNTSSPGAITVYTNNMQLITTFPAGSGGLTSPSQLAADPFGNVWALNSNSTLSKFSVAGGALSPAGGYSFPLVYGGSTEVGPTGNAAEVISSMSIDPSGNVWAVYNYQCYIEFANNGSVTQNPSGSSFPFCGNLPLLSLPNAIGNDASGNILLFNQSNTSSVLKLDPAGDLLSPAAGYTQGGFGSQYASVDLMVYDRSQGQLWLSNDSNGQSIDAIKDDGTPVSGANGFTLPPTLFAWSGMAVDGAGNLWVADQFTNTLNGLTPAGSAVTPLPYNISVSLGTSSLVFPGAIAVDAYGSVWVANWGSSTLVRVIGGVAVPKNYQ
jgi:hypothetical protein